jgi:hypothetical protein
MKDLMFLVDWEQRGLFDPIISVNKVTPLFMGSLSWSLFLVRSLVMGSLFMGSLSWSLFFFLVGSLVIGGRDLSVEFEFRSPSSSKTWCVALFCARKFTGFPFSRWDPKVSWSSLVLDVKFDGELESEVRNLISGRYEKIWPLFWKRELFFMLGKKFWLMVSFECPTLSDIADVTNFGSDHLHTKLFTI